MNAQLLPADNASYVNSVYLDESRTKNTSRLTAAVYRAYGHDGALLYVGCTADPRRRLNEHRSKTPWWRDHVARVVVGPMRSRKVARAEESDTIRVLAPRFNVSGTKWFDDEPNPAARLVLDVYEASGVLGITADELFSLLDAGDLPPGIGILWLGTCVRFVWHPPMSEAR